MNGRAKSPFLWTPQQPIRHDSLLGLLRGDEITRDDDGVNRWFLARCVVRLDAPPEAAEIVASSDGRFRLHVNEKTVGHGPTRSNPLFKRTDSFSVTGLMHAGKNVICMLINLPGIDLAWYERTRGNWQPIFGDGGLFCELFINNEAMPRELDWRITKARAWNRETPHSGWGQNFIEDFDANHFDWEWLGANFNDSNWPIAQPMISIGSNDDVAKGWGRVEAFPQRQPSHLPAAVRNYIPACKIVWIRRAECDAHADLDRQLYEAAFSERLPAEEEAFAAFLRGDCETASLQGSEEVIAVMLAMPEYHAGYPVIEVEASGGEEILMAFGEAIPGEYNGLGKTGDGLRRAGHLDGAHMFRLKLRPGRQSFEKFDLVAARSIQIIIRNASGPVSFRRIGLVESHFPVEQINSFTCSDLLINKLWRVGRRTAALCMHDSWVDCPGREKRHWVGDAAIDLEIAACAFGPSALPLSRQSLLTAAESQRTDGLVQMFAPGDHHHFGMTIPDFTLHWIISSGRYLELSGDIDLMRQLYPRIETALAWFERQSAGVGALADIPHWHFIEWAHIGRTGISGPINALYGGALAAAALIADRIGAVALAGRHRSMRDALSDRLNRWHWDPERGVYADSVAIESKQRGARISQHMNALMIYFGMAPSKRWKPALEYVTDPNRVRRTSSPPIVKTDLPFDEKTHVVEAQAYFAHYLYDALARAGRVDDMLQMMRDYYGPMLATGTSTLWEGPDPIASLCHVFSATPVYQLSRHVLGMREVCLRERRAVISPNLGCLSNAEGVVSTIAGEFEFEWRMNGDALEGSVKAPDGIEVSFQPPPGFNLKNVDPARGKNLITFCMDETTS